MKIRGSNMTTKDERKIKRGERRRKYCQFQTQAHQATCSAG